MFLVEIRLICHEHLSLETILTENDFLFKMVVEIKLIWDKNYKYRNNRKGEIFLV